MIRRIAAVLLLGALLAGCATMQQPPANVGASFCSVVTGPIRWHAGDTRGTKEQADKINRTGRKLCGWGKKK
jgi:hypothetical protein